MEKYLYLIPFNDLTYFKIGVSSVNLHRVCSFKDVYDVSFYNTIIVTANPKCIPALERELLCIYPNVNDKKTHKKPGYTELREYKYFDDCLYYISNKHPNLNIKINKFFDMIKF
jgi:hypothetical protein